MTSIRKNEVLAFIFGIVVGGVFTSQLLVPTFSTHDGTHQITQPDEKYHVHADFLIYIRDEKIDLAEAIYMTTAEQELHEHAHLHDGNGEVKHLHSPEITFVEFMNSLGLNLTDDCLTYEGEKYCSNETEQLRLFVNDESFIGDITEYEITDEDRLLIYYGVYDEEVITSRMNEVKNDACYYSGTCPERGIAPPESCGLTCEL